MPEYAFALYNAFSDSTFGGSKAGIIADASDLDADSMQCIATEIGAPATCFITGMDEFGVDVRFFSTLTEYDVCGHASICLMTWLVENHLFKLDHSNSLSVSLRTPASSTQVEIHLREDGRPEVMLPLTVAVFEPCAVNTGELAALFEIDEAAIDTTIPIELTRSDFTHLMVPLRNLATLQILKPDFAAIRNISLKLQVDTISLFTRETVLAESSIHSREFCPAVGTPEAPATGTTNRALVCYLLRHGLLDKNSDGERIIIAEQGYEMGRPSRIRTAMRVKNGQAVNIKVGGVATKSMDGKLIVDRTTS